MDPTTAIGVLPAGSVYRRASIACGSGEAEFAAVYPGLVTPLITVKTASFNGEACLKPGFEMDLDPILRSGVTQETDQACTKIGDVLGDATSRQSVVGLRALKLEMTSRLQIAAQIAAQIADEEGPWRELVWARSEIRRHNEAGTQMRGLTLERGTRAGYTNMFGAQGQPTRVQSRRGPRYHRRMESVESETRNGYSACSTLEFGVNDFKAMKKNRRSSASPELKRGNVPSFVVSRSKGGGSTKSSVVENCDPSVWVLSAGGPESTPDERGLPAERWAVPLRDGVSPMARPFSAVQHVRMREVGEPMKPPQELPASSFADDDFALEGRLPRASTPPPSVSFFPASLLPSTPTSSSTSQRGGAMLAFPRASSGFATAFAGLQPSPPSRVGSFSIVRKCSFRFLISPGCANTTSSPTRSPDAPASGRGSSSSAATAVTPPPSTTQPQAIPQWSENQANLLGVPLSLTTSALPPSNISRVSAYNTDRVDAGQVLIRTDAREQAAHPRKRCRSDASVEGPNSASIAREIKKLRLQPASNASSSSNSSNGNSVSVRSTPPTTPGDDGGALFGSEGAFFFPADNIPRADDQDEPSDESDEERESEEAAEARHKAKGKGRAVEEDVATSTTTSLEAMHFRQAIAASNATDRPARSIGDVSTSSAPHLAPPLFDEETLDNDDACAPEGEEEGDCESQIQAPLTPEEILQIISELESGSIEQVPHLGDASTPGDTYDTGNFMHFDSDPAPSPVHVDAHYAQQGSGHHSVELQGQPLIDIGDPYHPQGCAWSEEGLTSSVPHYTGFQQQEFFWLQPVFYPPQMGGVPFAEPVQDLRHVREDHSYSHLQGQSTGDGPQTSEAQHRILPGMQPYSTQPMEPYHQNLQPTASSHPQPSQVAQGFDPSHWHGVPPGQQGPHPPAQSMAHHIQQAQSTQSSASAQGSHYTFQLTLPAQNVAAPAPSVTRAGPVACSNSGTGPNMQNPPEVGLAAATPGASNHDDLHTCGWLVYHRGRPVGKCGSSIRNDLRSITSHIAQKHDVDPESSERKSCGWASGPSLGKSKRCSHDPAQRNIAQSLRKLHVGPKAYERHIDRVAY
ncbi:hypothetical protein FA13DRAFT_1714604 [Coprinellus micaceus]|uniref:Uncharacterized protein n=1 Tax=Coprinellus micaceus TaxID=71717 RepID=A0A4Y7SRX7_COPMI|nr:hypothetical protein FA13DRAFT_1714604 [Coprinellus micaceus]